MKLQEQVSTDGSVGNVYAEVGPADMNGSAVEATDTSNPISSSDTDRLSPIEDKLKLLWPSPQKLTIHPGEMSVKLF